MRKNIPHILLTLMLASVIAFYGGLNVFASVQSVFSLDDDTDDTSKTDISIQNIPVTDLDIEDAQSPMIVGTSQILLVSVIPADASDKTISYTSLTPEIASVNALGRVTALTAGTAIIQVSAGAVTRSVSIRIESPHTETAVLVSSIDVEYEATMTVGTAQTLYPSVLPISATPEIGYSSANTRVATVNDFGKVTALSAGTATITISADGTRKSISITVVEEIKVTEIDIGDVLTEMTIGSSQSISVSIFPPDAVDQKIEYASGNRNVLTVNAFGRVDAVGLGSANITVYVGAVSKTVSISVKEKIIPTDIDFDIVETKINVGSSINIGATVLPVNADDQTITYTSSDMSVLAVNELGRVKGISLGTATVTLQAGNVRKSVTFEVVTEDVVATIEIAEFNEKMKIEDTQTISATLYPNTARDQKIKYTSNNPAVASVSEGGVVTANAKGTATMTVAAGAAVKELQVTVYVATEKIEVPESYLIMQPSDSHQILASVSPGGADHHLTYRSTNEKIAVVNAQGAVTALSPGRASIIIANFDNMKAITVIVNEGSVLLDISDGADTPNGVLDQNYGQILAAQIQEAIDGTSIAVNGAEYPLITKDVLRALYQTSKSVNVFYDGYVISIDGTDIKNAENVLATDIYLAKTDAGLSFVINEKRNLPGSIGVEFLSLDSGYRYLYLYNEATQKYERLNHLDGSAAVISLTGEYVLSKSKLDGPPFGVYMIIAAAMLIVVCAAVYVLLRKRHWFW